MIFGDFVGKTQDCDKIISKKLGEKDLGCIMHGSSGRIETD
jgi:hypothetical protein